MKRKPTSYSDMLKTVIAVKGLEDEDKLFLLAIAVNASATGKHAYPGHEALKERIGMGNTTVTARYRKLEALGLISLVPSTRKGIAHCFDINLAHEAFPETYIGRTVGNMQESNDDVAAPKVIVGNPKESNDVIVGLKAGHRCFDEPSSLELTDVIVGNPQESNAYPRLPSLHTTLPLHPNHQTIAATDITDVCVCEYRKKEKEVPAFGREKPELIRLGLANFEEFKRALHAFLRDAPWLRFADHTNYPFRLFVEGYKGYVAAAKTFVERVPLSKEVIAATIEASQKASAEAWSRPEPEVDPEGAAEDLFGELPVIPDGSSEESNNE